VVEHGTRVTHWRLLPDVNITALAARTDIILRGASQFVLNADRMMLLDKRQTFQFVLTRPIYDAEVAILASSLSSVYAEHLRSDGKCNCKRPLPFASVRLS